MTAQPELSDDDKQTRDDYGNLRSLILGDDYESVIKQRLKKNDTERVADVLAEAFEQRNRSDQQLARHMSPIIEASINKSIQNNRQKFADLIYPAVGPAVRKSVASALSEMIASLNELLRQSLTIDSIKARLKARRLGMSYAEYLIVQNLHFRVEQVFLIHRDSGLLIDSCCLPGEAYKDPDLVSAMLTAITDFMKDAFEAEQDHSAIDAIQFGERTLLIETGPHAALAIAVRGVVSAELEAQLQAVNESVHARYSQQLQDFKGDSSDFQEISVLLQSLLIEETKTESTKKGTPWFSIVTLSAIVLIACYFLFLHWQRQSFVERSIDRINSLPGYSVIDSTMRDDRLNVEVIRSPGAVSLAVLMAKLHDDRFSIRVTNVLGELSSPELFLPQLRQKYGLNLSLKSSDQGPVLMASGEASSQRLSEFLAEPLLANLFVEVDYGGVTIRPRVSEKAASQSLFNALVDDIQSESLYFGSGEIELDEAELKKAIELVTKLQQLIDLQKPSDFRISQISLYGYADRQGDKGSNQSISQQRAEYVAQLFKSNGIGDDLIVVWGLGVKDTARVPLNRQRRVSVNLLIDPVGD